MPDARKDILPQEVIRPTSFMSLAVLLGFVVILVFLANFAASAVLKRLPVNRGYALAHGKWELMDNALDARANVDVLIVGDSSSNQGLNPHVIERETGLSAMNFGVVAEALTVEPTWAADRFMEVSTRNGNPPKAILWMHVYDVWSRVDRNERRLKGISASLPSSAWPYIERGPKVRIPIRDLWLMQQVPLYFQNTSLANLIRRPIASIEESRRFKFDERGFTSETTPDPDLVRRDRRNHLKLARETESFLPTTLSRRTIDAMGHLSNKYNIDIHLVQSPSNRELWKDEVFRSRWFEVRDALRKAAAPYPRLRLMFDEPVLFDDEQMQNCDHVLADAAEAFTRIVIERSGLNAAASQPATQPAK